MSGRQRGTTYEGPWVSRFVLWRFPICEQVAFIGPGCLRVSQRWGRIGSTNILTFTEYAGILLCSAAVAAAFSGTGKMLALLDNCHYILQSSISLMHSFQAALAACWSRGGATATMSGMLAKARQPTPPSSVMRTRMISLSPGGRPCHRAEVRFPSSPYRNAPRAEAASHFFLG